jgi:hypothetical protein
MYRGYKGRFGPKSDEVTGGWGQLHDGKFHNLYFPPNIIRMIKSRKMRRTGHVARMGENKTAYRILVGKPEGMRPLGRPRRMWGGGVIFERILERYSMDWIDLSQDRDQ